MFGLFKKKTSAPKSPKLPKPAQNRNPFIGKITANLRCPICTCPYEITYDSSDFEKAYELQPPYFEILRQPCDFCKNEFVMIANEIGQHDCIDEKWLKVGLMKDSDIAKKKKQMETMEAKKITLEIKIKDLETNYENLKGDEDKKYKIEEKLERVSEQRDSLEERYDEMEDSIMQLEDKFEEREQKNVDKWFKWKEKFEKKHK